MFPKLFSNDLDFTTCVSIPRSPETSDTDNLNLKQKKKIESVGKSKITFNKKE